MRGAAATWVRSNCINAKMVKDLLRFLFDASAAGANCWFLIGGGLLRSGSATLVHCFVGELFVFQLTDRQAALQGADSRTMCSGLGRSPFQQMRAPANVAISLDRLELLNTALNQTTPIFGRVDYEVLANGGGRSACGWTTRWATSTATRGIIRSGRCGAGIVYFPAKQDRQACGVPGLLNSGLEKFFGVSMGTIRMRAARVEQLLTV
jgi:hypothetical protein